MPESRFSPCGLFGKLPRPAQTSSLPQPPTPTPSVPRRGLGCQRLAPLRRCALPLGGVGSLSSPEGGRFGLAATPAGSALLDLRPLFLQVSFSGPRCLPGSPPPFRFILSPPGQPSAMMGLNSPRWFLPGPAARRGIPRQRSSVRRLGSSSSVSNQA